ncbi:MAG: hypothetical protein A2X80_07915 [Geobacteraceae bacterium GWB2_52_12]|nr:MAG: hypothetical protein A2X80_07915 [Geobacteraceae bacterium GWB2_52_12]
MLNKIQRDHLAKLSFKVVEILLAGVVIGGFMSENGNHTGKILFGLSLVPMFILVGLILSAGEDEPP